MSISQQDRPCTWFEWLATALVVLLVAGVANDIWAHNHDLVDQSFFTPWHAILYGSMALNGIVLGIFALRARGLQFLRADALPRGYCWSLYGVMLFTVGGLLDLVWHALFGIESDVDALLSPTHLVLMLAALSIIAGPLRSALARVDSFTSSSWKVLGPAVLSATGMYVIVLLFTEYAHPFYDVQASKKIVPPIPVAQVYEMDASGERQIRRVVDPAHSFLALAPSPDGKRVVYVMRHSSDFTAELHVADTDFTNARQITRNGAFNAAPVWSPKGDEIAYISRSAPPNAAYRVMILNLQSGAERTIAQDNGGKEGVTWSPDASRVAYASDVDGSYRIYFARANGDALGRLNGVRGKAISPAWSPDGSTLTYCADDGLYTIDIAGKHDKRLVAGLVFSPRWSPNGKKIVFSMLHDHVQDVYTINANGTNLRDLSRNPSMRNVLPAWSADGTRIEWSGVGYLNGLSTYARQSSGVGAILLQTLILVAFMILLVRRFRLPVGALTVFIVIGQTAIATLNDQYALLPGAVLAGVLSDLLLWSLLPCSTPRKLYILCFFVPAFFYGTYFLSLALTVGVSWTVHMIAGSIVLSGLTGTALACIVLHAMGSADKNANYI